MAQTEQDMLRISGYSPLRQSQEVGIERVRAWEKMELKYSALKSQVRGLRNEVNCRIEHGADSGGHLEAVQDFLDSILGSHDY